MTKDTMIGVDLAKSVFQLHGASATGQVLFRKKLSRPAFTKFMAEHPPVTVVLEACGSAHYWARELSRLGHEVKLIAAQYVRPFVKRHKNDAADAEAIVIAAQRPEMRFVEAKTAEQQSRAMLFRARVRLVRQRTELVNMLRAFLYELGYVVPQGIHHLPRIATIIADPGNDLPEIARMECNELLEQIEVMTVRIATSDRRIKSLTGQADISRRLQTMPGVGPLTALAIEAFGEHRSTGERKYYLSNLPVDTPLRKLAGAIKARWVCEQAHQQLKEELGLDHFEGRSWQGLHRHTLMSMIAFAFLQARRLRAAGRKKRSSSPPPQPTLPAIRQAILTQLSQPPPPTCPHCRRRWRRMIRRNLPK